MKFEKLHELKKGKHAVTGLCMALGLTLLTSAVYASYDDANGYQNYKESIKRLAFKENNFTAQISAKIYADGQEVAGANANVKADGANSHSKNSSSSKIDAKDDTSSDEMYIVKNGKAYNIDNKYKTYYVTEADYEQDYNIFGLPNLEEDPTANRLVRFLELSADAFIGDIKNNFVLESKKDGIKNYTVSASEVQIPEVINAGVSLVGGLGSNYDSGTEYLTTRYEDYDEAMKAYYKAQTGKDLPDDYYDNEEIEKVLDGFYELEDKYSDKKSGALVVYKDASTKYYKTLAEAMEDPANQGVFNTEDYLAGFLGKDAWIKSGKNDFSIDEKGRLLTSDITVVFGTEDASGNKHEIKVVVNLKIKDYGTTKVELPNLDGYTKNDGEPILYEADEVKEDKVSEESANKLDDKEIEDKKVQDAKEDDRKVESAKADDKKVEEKKAEN